MENLTEDDQLNINYDGWKSSYDEKVDYISSRIEPFRMITVGYTGQKNNTKRETWSFHLDDLEDLKGRVDKTIESEFGNFKDAYDATQFLRGELFCYVDAILSN